MKKFFEWIKNHRKKVIIIVILSALIIIFGIPVIINVCFKIPAPCNMLEPEWEASDVLAYYGGILGFLGTASLSVLALYQNYEIKKESDAKQALLEKMAHEKDMPLFRVENLTLGSNLCLRILNVSDNVAYDLEVGDFAIENTEGKCVCKSRKANTREGKIFGREETVIEFENDYFSGKNLRLYFQIKCKDKFSMSHTYIVSSYMKDAKEFKTPYIVKEVEKRG